MAEAGKHCPRCGKTKHRSEFHRNRSKSDGLHDYCKECQRAAVKTYQAAHGKHILNRAYRYGLTKEEVHSFLEVPVCQCCGKPFAAGDDQCIDHCHEHGHVRGVVCHPCNGALRGTAKEAMVRAARCEQYLIRDWERNGIQG